MKIKEMFAKPIDRDIKGVIKVGQDDDLNIQQELEEYVVTRELQKHFRDFFSSYKQGINGYTDKMGVWISGFFGSGKSHFLKILSYLLANKDVNGQKVLEYFKKDGKIKDATVMADMQLAASVPTDVVLFNIDSKSEQNGKTDKDSIISVFLKVFNEMQGFYGPNPHIADLERKLTEDGLYADFKARFAESFGSEWTEARNDFLFVQDDIVDVLAGMGFMSEEAARNWCETAAGEYTFSIERFAELVKRYIDRKGHNHHVVFCVDEMGQYIGSNSKLMLNLQTVAEDLGTACQGKAWIIVTSQQDIDSITNVQGNDFSKIQGRFDTRLSLSSANVDEVIRERILKKTPVAAESLSAYYDVNNITIKNRIVFNDGIEKKLYTDNKNFVEVYPFITYQFNLLGSVLTSIRTHGASGKHLAEGERSMLALFKEGAMQVMYDELGTLVPFHYFYDALEQFLDHSHKGVISRALENELLNPEHAENCFTVNVLKTLFMIKYVKEIKANVTNITSLMVSNVNDDRKDLESRVEDALKSLVRQTLVQKNGDIYVFLTDEEQEINLSIKNQPVDLGEITAKAAELIFDDIYAVTRYRYPKLNGRYAFSFNQVLDDKPYKNVQKHDITLKILTPNSEEIADDNTLRMLSTQSECVLVVLPEDRTFLEEIQVSLQIEKFLRFDATNTLTKYEQIKEAKKVELRERKSAARLFIEEALKAATIYVNGDRLQLGTKDITARLNEAMGKLVDLVYNKLYYIDTATGESDIRSLLKDNGSQLTLDGKVHTPNQLALDDVNNYITMTSSHHMKVSMKTLLDRFMKPPYGFVEADVQWLVAKLFKDGNIAYYVNSEPVTLLSKTVDELVRFVTRKEYVEKLLVEKRERATDKQKKTVRQVMKEVFNHTIISDEDDVVMAEFLRDAASLSKDLAIYAERYVRQTKYPGEEVVKTGKRLLQEALQLKFAKEFFDTIDKKRDDYLDFAEDFAPVKDFFGGNQVNIFDKAILFMNIFEASKTYIVDAELERTAQSIKGIMQKPAPYGDIYKLPELLDKYSNAYAQLLDDMLVPIGQAISEARTRVSEELQGKLCREKLQSGMMHRFDELREKAESTNNVADMNGIKLEADALKVRCLNEIEAAERKLLEAKAQQEKPVTPAPAATTTVTPVPVAPKPKLKKQRTISIKQINTASTWQLATEADVKKYVAELERRLLAQLEEDTVVNVEF